MGVARLRSGTLKSVVTRHAASGIILSEFRVHSQAPRAAARERLPEPSALEMAGHAGVALAKWSAAGWPIAPAPVRAVRHAICRGCEFWDPAGWVGFGKCRHQKCGCSRMKHALATERCPIDKWGAVVG